MISNYSLNKLSYTLFLLLCVTDANCDDAFVIDSTCYKIHKETVDWFAAVNRCLSNNASLAVFDDDVRRYFPSNLLSDEARIGLVKSWWTWPGYLSLKHLLSPFKVSGYLFKSLH